MNERTTKVTETRELEEGKFAACPFCRGRNAAVAVDFHSARPEEAYVKCPGCGAQGPRVHVDRHNMQDGVKEARRRWNDAGSFEKKTGANEWKETTKQAVTLSGGQG